VHRLQPQHHDRRRGKFTLTVTGLNFTANSKIVFNGVTHDGTAGTANTTFVSASQVTTTIAASEIAAAGTATVTVSDVNGTPFQAVSFAITGGSDMTVSMSNTPATFSQGDSNDTYTINVKNSGTSATSGTVSMVVSALPSGLSLVSLTGTNWSCASLTCTRSDALAGGATYDPIALKVNVAGNATSPQTVNVTVSGGGESNTANDTASDPTTVTAASDMTVAVTPSSTTVVRGQNNVPFSVTATNSGSSTSGQVNVSISLPAGITSTNVSGTGWTCPGNAFPCSRSDVLANGQSYPAIAMTVNVAQNTAPSVSITATVSGGGELNTANDTGTSSITTVAETVGLTSSVNPSAIGASTVLTATVFQRRERQ